MPGSLAEARPTGCTLLGISFWDSEDDRRASDELGRTAREQVHQSGGGRGEPVRKDWEILIDDPP